MPKRVVFVCVENSNRSQMAQAFAQMIGGPDVEAYSAGSRPSGRVNPKAVTAMAELGYDLTTHSSKGLDEFNGKEFDAAVTMGCGDACPLVAAARRGGRQIPAPPGGGAGGVRGGRGLVREQVRGLVAELGIEGERGRKPPE